LLVDVAFPGAGPEMMVDDFQNSDFTDRVKIRWLSERRGEIRLPMDRLAGKFSMTRLHARTNLHKRNGWKLLVLRSIWTDKDDGKPKLRKK
jgi:hypothetical protein